MFLNGYFTRLNEISKIRVLICVLISIHKIIPVHLASYLFLKSSNLKTKVSAVSNLTILIIVLSSYS